MRFILCLALLATAACTAPKSAEPAAPAAAAPARLTAEIIDSGFPDAHDSYNAISCAIDGRIYYVLSTEKADLGAQMYVYDPKT